MGTIPEASLPIPGNCRGLKDVGRSWHVEIRGDLKAIVNAAQSRFFGFSLPMALRCNMALSANPSNITMKKRENMLIQSDSPLSLLVFHGCLDGAAHWRFPV
jgi:hypothetical protein